MTSLELELKITSGMLRPNGNSYDICISSEDHDVFKNNIEDFSFRLSKDLNLNLSYMFVIGGNAVKFDNHISGMFPCSLIKYQSCNIIVKGSNINECNYEDYSLIMDYKVYDKEVPETMELPWSVNGETDNKLVFTWGIAGTRNKYHIGDDKTENLGDGVIRSLSEPCPYSISTKILDIFVKTKTKPEPNMVIQQITVPMVKTHNGFRGYIDAIGDGIMGLQFKNNRGEPVSPNNITVSYVKHIGQYKHKQLEYTKSMLKTIHCEHTKIDIITQETGLQMSYTRCILNSNLRNTLIHDYDIDDFAPCDIDIEYLDINRQVLHWPPELVLAH